MGGHHSVRRPFSGSTPISYATKSQFPVIKRVGTTMPLEGAHTKVSYYSIRMDRTPPQDELFNLCMISANNEAFIKIFETYSNRHSFVAPSMVEVSTILLAPTDHEWKISYLDLEVQERNENSELAVTIQRYVPYYGDIETSCMFVPERLPNEHEKMEGLEAYGRQKQNANTYTLGFLVGGTGLFQATLGIHSAVVFVFGCAIGMVYQLLLQHEIDHLGRDRMFVNSAVRLAAVSVAVAAIMNNTIGFLPIDLWIGYTGFLMQKVALWIAFL